MNAMSKISPPVVGFNIPAEPGMSIDEIATPALIIDLDAFERNIRVMRDKVKKIGIRLRAHAKTHKSADIAHYQIKHGGACGVCCQKTSEAEALIAAGITDILVSNQIVADHQIDRLARLAGQARLCVCVDDRDNIDALAAAAQKHGTTIGCLVEIDCGAGRCGVAFGAPVVNLAKKIATSSGLRFAGLQAYQGAAQHVVDYQQRKSKIDAAIAQVAETVAMLKAENLACDIIGGGGTGTYDFEAASGVYNELQCGSYIFMDADYQRVCDEKGDFLHEFENSLFILTTIMSKTKSNTAICDAGLKAQSVDSGMPTVFGRNDVTYIKCADEHGVIADPDNTLKLNDRLKLVPGHCDPTCNIHDWYVGVRGNRVESLWPVTARGRMF